MLQGLERGCSWISHRALVCQIRPAGRTPNLGFDLCRLALNSRKFWPGDWRVCIITWMYWRSTFLLKPIWALPSPTLKWGNCTYMNAPHDHFISLAIVSMLNIGSSRSAWSYSNIYIWLFWWPPTLPMRLTFASPLYAGIRKARNARHFHPTYFPR